MLLGPPASGKGTQSELIQRKFQIPVTSTGAILRREAKLNTSAGREAGRIISKGALAPDDLVLTLVGQWLDQHREAFLFDGFPRTIPQAQQLDAILERRGFGKPLVVEFRVDPEVLLHRLSGRWTCSVGGETYNVHERAPKVPGICDNDGGKLVQRSDDRAEVVKERLAAYDRQTKPLADYYRRHGVLEIVDGTASVEEVSRALNEIFKRAEGRDGHL